MVAMLGVFVPGAGLAECIKYKDYLGWIGTHTWTGGAHDIAVHGDVAFIAGHGAHSMGTWPLLVAVDLSVPSIPVSLDELTLSGFSSTEIFVARANGVAVVGHHAFIATEDRRLITVDISAPHELTVVGQAEIGEVARKVAVSGDVAVVTTPTGMRVLDVAVPAVPTVVGTYAAPAEPSDIALEGSCAFISTPEGLLAVDISVPSTPVFVGSVLTPDEARGVVIEGPYAYVAGESGFRIVDLSTPSELEIVGTYHTSASNRCVAVRGSMAFVGGE